MLDLSKAERDLVGPLQSNEFILETQPARLGYLQPVPERERSDRTALWKRLNNQGYLFFKKFIDPEKVFSFREYYFKTLAVTGLLQEGSQPVDGIAGRNQFDGEKLRELLFNEIVPGATYNALCTTPEIVQFYEWFLGGNVFLHKRKILRHVRPGTRQATGAHYDLVYLRGGTANVYTSWLPLGDCPVEEGGLIYLEGSHQQFRHLEQNSVPNNKAAWLTKDLPSLASRHNTRWLIGDYEAGDMVIHTAYTVHASLNNNSSMERFRLSTDIRYQLLSDTIDLRWQNHWRDDDGL